MSLLAALIIVPPSGGTNVSVAPFWKLLPLIVSLWLPFNGAIEGGDTLLMEGADATTDEVFPTGCEFGKALAAGFGGIVFG